MKDWEIRFDGLNIIRITVKVDEDEAFVSTHDESSDIVKDFIRQEKQNLLLQIEVIVGKKYTFKEVDWGDGIKSMENEQDETKAAMYCEGYNQAIDDFTEKFNKLKE